MASSSRVNQLAESMNKTLTVNGNGPTTGDGDQDSGVDESTQNVTTPGSPTKKSTHPSRSRSKGAEGTLPKLGANAKGLRSQSVPKPFQVYTTGPNARLSTAEKRIPMNKVKVGAAGGPNLRNVRSKVGSMVNNSHKPGGGEVKIETRKLEWKAGPRTQANNSGYVPRGGDKKIESRALAWNATSKVGSLQNANHRPGGGEKKVVTQKLEWNSGSKVGSTINLKHKPGGGNVKILNTRVDVASARSKVGSMDNVRHRPGGGNVQIFNDVEYLRDASAASTSASAHSLGGSRSSSRRQSASQLNPPETKPKYSVPKPATLQSKTIPTSSAYSSMIKRKISPMSSGY